MRSGGRGTCRSHEVRQVNADDRVNTVLRRGGAGELDDVALLNAGQVRGLIGGDSKSECRRSCEGGQRDGAERREGGRDQRGEQLDWP